MNSNVLFHNDIYLRDYVINNRVYRGKYKQLRYGDKSQSVDLQVYNFENGPIHRYKHALNSSFTDNHYKTIIVIRDIYNVVASSIKSSNKNNMSVYISRLIDRWKGHCREVLDQTDYVSGDKKIFVNYNTWFLDEQYRHLIAMAIGFKNKEMGIEKVTPFGGGSSFGDKKNARQMKVFDRFWDYTDHELFKLIDEEARSLNKEVFGFDLNDLENGYYKLNNYSG